MKSLNKVQFIGNLTRDPELKVLQGDMNIATISLATNRSIKEKDGNFIDKAEFHRVTAFGKTAELANTYLRKGSKIYMEGRIQPKKWEDNEGKTHYGTDIVASKIMFLTPKRMNDTGEVEPEKVNDLADLGAPDQDLPF